MHKTDKIIIGISSCRGKKLLIHYTLKPASGHRCDAVCRKINSRIKVVENIDRDKQKVVKTDDKQFDCFTPYRQHFSHVTAGQAF